MWLCSGAAQLTDQPQSVVRNGDWSDAPELALAPQLSAQVDVPFDFSAKREDDREKEKEERKRGGRGRSFVQMVEDPLVRTTSP